MAPSAYALEDQASSAWGNSVEGAPEVTIKDAVEKEKIIKDILGLRGGLKGLVERIHTVQGETEKLSKDNQMLQVYIDNLTRNSVVAAGKR